MVNVGPGGIPLDDVLVHDETNRALANLLLSFEPPTFPMALGVVYCNPAPAYEDEVYEQLRAAMAARKSGDLAGLVRSGRTWEVG